MNSTATAALREIATKYGDVVITGEDNLVIAARYAGYDLLSDLTALINEHYVAKEDIATEVERRIKERLPSEEESKKEQYNHADPYSQDRVNGAYWDGYEDGFEKCDGFIRSHLTEKTEGEQQMWRDIQLKDREG